MKLLKGQYDIYLKNIIDIQHYEFIGQATTYELNNAILINEFIKKINYNNLGQFTSYTDLDILKQQLGMVMEDIEKYIPELLV